MRAVRVGVVLAVVSALLAGAGSCSEDAPPCPVAADGTTECGVLFGVTTERPTLRHLREAEAFAGRPYDLVYRFHGLYDEAPDAEERAIVASGRLLHVNIETRVASEPEGHTWRDVSSGRFDEGLRAQAEGLGALDAPVFVTFDHEMDLPKKTVRGTPRDFVAAWRHVHRLFADAGADNVVWVWVASGVEANLERAGRAWPGNDVVDWVSWDVYNPSGCKPDKPTRTLEQSLDVFYGWLRENGSAVGIDLAKPMMVSELGGVVRPQDPMSRSEWYAELPRVLRERPQIRAVTFWDHDGTCDYRYTDVPGMRGVVHDLGDAAEFARLDVAPLPRP